MSEWPDPQPEPGETAQRWVIGVLVVGAALLFLNARGNDDARGFNFAMPNISMPDFSLPEISLPNIPEIDLRGRESEAPASEIADSITANITESLGASAVSGAGPISVPFETCVSMLAESANQLGQAPIIAEDTPDRRVTRFKLIEGNLTMTCSRADNTLTIEQPG